MQQKQFGGKQRLGPERNLGLSPISDVITPRSHCSTLELLIQAPGCMKSEPTRPHGAGGKKPRVGAAFCPRSPATAYTEFRENAMRFCRPCRYQKSMTTLAHRRVGARQ